MPIVSPSSVPIHPHPVLFFFFFNDTATTEIYTLSLHDALPIFPGPEIDLSDATAPLPIGAILEASFNEAVTELALLDRKSTRLNSSHGYISYAVFCLKKKKKYR